jgi:RHS repeat-associated protein
MGYDASGRRVTKAVNGTGAMDATTHYYLSGQSVAETRNGSDLLLEQFVPGPTYVDELVQVAVNSDPPNQTACDYFYWACQDANFNVLGLIDDGGNLAERYEYSAYGQRQVFYCPGFNDPGCFAPAGSSQVANSLGTPFNAFGHQGLMHDEETGLVYNRERYLHSGLGRFMLRDPAEYVDGLNLYETEQCSPVDQLDPTGLVSAGDFLASLKTFIPRKIGDINWSRRLLTIPIAPPAVTAEINIFAYGEVTRCCSRKSDMGFVFHGAVGLEVTGGIGTSIGGNSGIKFEKKQVKSGRTETRYYQRRGTINPSTGQPWHENARGHRIDDPNKGDRGNGGDLPFGFGATGPFFGGKLEPCPESIEGGLTFTVGVSGFASAGYGWASVGVAFDYPLGNCKIPGGCEFTWRDGPTGGVVYGQGTGTRVQIYGRGEADMAIPLFP